MGVNAQAIVNADFSSLDGWTAVTSESFHNEGNGLIGTYKVHEDLPAATVDEKHLATEYCLGVEARWEGSYSSFTQETAELPAGEYMLLFDVENSNTATTKAVYENRFSVKVGENVATDSYTEWMDGASSWKTHGIKFTLAAAGKATISLGYGTGTNNVKHTNSPALYISHLKLVSAAEGEAILQGQLDAETAAKIAAKAELVEGASVINPVYAPFVVNGTFDSNIDGWSRTGSFSNNKTANNKEGAFVGNFYENWNGVALANKMYQVIEYIPNGVYKLCIAAFVNTLANPNTSQFVFANNDKVYLTDGEPTMYEVYTKVEYNRLEVGLEQAEAVANWMGIDNVSLVYYGADCTVAEAKNADQNREPLFIYQKYIICNVASGKYWSAGDGWGTQASLVSHSEYVKLVPQKDGTYFMESQVNNGGKNYYFNGDYMDNANPIKLIVKQLPNAIGTKSDGTALYGYTIANVNNQYFGWDGTSTILGKNIDANSDNAIWTIVPLTEAKAAISSATAEEPVDATHFIEDHSFGRNNRYSDRWEGTGLEKGGENTNLNVQAYMKTFDTYQTIAEVPNGVYKIDAQAAVTFHDNRTIKEYDGNGYPVIYANDAESNFNEMISEDQLKSQSKMSTQFSAGLYQVEPVYVKVTDGTLKIGAKSSREDIWAVWDNFVLTYYGPDASIDKIKNAALVAEMEEWVQKVNAIYDNVPVQAIKDLMDAAIEKANNAETLDAMNEAIALLEASIEKANVAIAATPELAGMENVLNSTNVYTPEAYKAYKDEYDALVAKYEAGELTKEDVIENPEKKTEWHADNRIDDLLISAWDVEPMQWDDYHVNTWSTEGDTDGSNFKVPFVEAWIADGESLAQNDMTATLTNMDDGLYTVTALVRVRMKNGAEAPATGITMVVNDGEAVDVTAGDQVGNTQFYMKEFTASGIVKRNGELKIQFKVAEGNNISWLAFKNVKYVWAPIPEPVPVVAPENLVAEDYVLAAQDGEGKDVSGVVKVGFNENDVYFQGFCTQLPNTWVKGTLSEDGKKVTVEPEQFFGKYNDTQKLFFNYEGNAVTFAYDAEAGKFSTENVIKINNDQETVGTYANTVLTSKAVIAAAEEAAAKAEADAKLALLKTDVETLVISEEAKAYEAENVKEAVAAAETAITAAKTAVAAVEAKIAEGKLATDNKEALATAIAAADKAIADAKAAIAAAEKEYADQKAADVEAAAKEVADAKVLQLKTAAEALAVSAEAKAYEAENVQAAVAAAEEAIATAKTAVAAVETLIAEGKLATDNKEALAAAIAAAEEAITAAKTAIATAEETYKAQLLIDDAEAAEAAALAEANAKVAELKTAAETLAISAEAKAYEAENVQTAVAAAEQAIAAVTPAIAAVETVVAEGKLATDNKEALETAIAAAEQAIADAKAAIETAEAVYAEQKAADEAAAAEATALAEANAKLAELKVAAEALVISEEAKAYEAENVKEAVAAAEQAIAAVTPAIAAVETVVAEGKLATDNKEALETAIAAAEQAIADAKAAIETAENVYLEQKRLDDEAAAALAAAKAELQTAIDAAKAIDTEGMTDESVAVLTEAISAAEAALAAEDATVESLATALAVLKAAIAGLEEKPELKPVTPPADMAIETYTFSAIYRDNGGAKEVTRAIKVGFDGNDVYVNGLSYYLEDDSWVKGVMNADKTAVTFASPQMYGTIQEGYDAYFIINNYVSDEDDTYPTAYDFGYDAATGDFTIPGTCLLLEGSAPVNAFKCYGYYYAIAITKGEPAVPEPVVVPADLVAEEYSLVASDNEGKAVSGSVMVGFQGNDVFFQGFSTYLPEAWVKGTLSADGATVTVNPDQFLGTYSEVYDMFFNYKGYPLTFTYDAEAGRFVTENVIRIDNSQYWFEYYADAVLTKVVEMAAMPANPSISGVVCAESGDYMLFDVPAVDVNGNGLLTSKLSFQFFVEDSIGINQSEVKELVFTRDLYTKLAEDMTVIPYGFTDGYDFYNDAIYLNMPYDSWYKIGIKSVYTGGGETNETEIQWFTLKEKMIVDGISDMFADKNAVIYNMQGQKLDKPRNGLHIINGRKVFVKGKR